MKKTYIVRLTDEECQTCLAVVKKLKGTYTKVRQAGILLRADADRSQLERPTNRRRFPLFKAIR